jgi:hypothetical protein
LDLLLTGVVGTAGTSGIVVASGVLVFSVHGVEIAGTLGTAVASGVLVGAAVSSVQGVEAAGASGTGTSEASGVSAGAEGAPVGMASVEHGVLEGL